MPKIAPQNAKNASQFLNIFKKYFCLWRGKSFTTLGIFIVKWISSNNSNAVTFWNFIEFCFHKIPGTYSGTETNIHDWEFLQKYLAALLIIFMKFSITDT